MTSLIQELKGISDELKRLSDEAEARRKRMAREATEEQERAARVKADAALAKVPELTRLAARAGHREVVVYEHDGDEMNHDGGGMSSWPVGAAKLVQEGCKEMGFKTHWGGAPYGVKLPYAIKVSW